MPQLEEQRTGLMQRISEGLQGLVGLKSKTREGVFTVSDGANLEQQVRGLDEKINQERTALDQGLLNIENQPVSRQLIVGRQAALQKQSAIITNSLLFQRELLSGDLDKAYRYAEQAASEAYEDQTARINALSQALEYNKQFLDEANKEISDRLQGRLDIIKEQIKQEQNNRDTIISLAAQNPIAGITPVDTLQEALRKIGKITLEEQEFERGLKLSELKLGNADGTNNNYGRYTAQELRKLRAAKINPDDIEKADAFLYSGIKEISNLEIETIKNNIKNNITEGTEISEIKNEIILKLLPENQKQELIDYANKIEQERITEEEKEINKPSLLQKAGQVLGGAIKNKWWQFWK